MTVLAQVLSFLFPPFSMLQTSFQPRYTIKRMFITFYPASLGILLQKVLRLSALPYCWKGKLVVLNGLYKAVVYFQLKNFSFQLRKTKYKQSSVVDNDKIICGGCKHRLLGQIILVECKFCYYLCDLQKYVFIFCISVSLSIKSLNRSYLIGFL